MNLPVMTDMSESNTTLDYCMQAIVRESATLSRYKNTKI
jgi:hypothetical protein